MRTELNTIASHQGFQNTLEQINFAPVVDVLWSKHQWTPLQIKQGINQYKQLLFLLYCYPHEAIVPDRETDQVIHAHISTKDQYMADCEVLFNRALEHEQGFGTRGNIDQLAWLYTFHRTQRRIAQQFHQEPTLWLHPAYCVLRPEPT